MAQPYVGEIRLFAGNFAPSGWRHCDGTLLPITEHEALFQLIGTTYGGDGENTFALPDLRGRVPVHQGNGLLLAETAGTESVTLTVAQTPAHAHPLLASPGVGNDPNPGANLLAESSVVSGYSSADPSNPMRTGALTPAGGSQPHDNLQPYTVLTYIISLVGIFPSPT